MEKIIVFGATGLVGAYTAIYLKEKGYDIAAVGKRNSDNNFFKDNGIEYFSVDIKNKSDFSKLPYSDVAAVIHFAGAMPAHMEEYDAQEYINSIINGTLNVLEYARISKAERIVFSQSVSDVGYLFGKQEPIDEDSQMKFPLTGDHSVYSISKNAAVNLIQHYQAQFGIKGYILRLPTIYAYHPNPFYYVDGKKKKLGYRLLIEKAESGEQIEIWGNPKNVKELVYVNDFTQLVECCLKAKKDGGIYNAGNGFPHSFEEQVKVMCDALNPKNKKSELVYRPEMPSSPQFVLGIEKAKTELGYKPAYDIRQCFENFEYERKLQRFSKLWGNEDDYKINGGGYSCRVIFRKLFVPFGCGCSPATEKAA